MWWNVAGCRERNQGHNQAREDASKERYGGSHDEKISQPKSGTLPSAPLIAGFDEREAKHPAKWVFINRICSGRSFVIANQHSDVIIGISPSIDVY